MNPAAYLARINYNGSTEPTLPTLQALHKAHLLAVPFENLDIHLGQTIILDEDKLFKKIVERRRGGFCYELNGLFAALLRALGYRVTYLSAHVINREGIAGPEFDHLALRVDLDKPYLVDVGFGENFREPLELNQPHEQFQDGKFYRIKPVENDQLLLEQRDPQGEWEGGYLFSLKPYRLEDFTEMCYYQQTSPLSAFTKRRVAVRMLPQGWMKLKDLELSVESQQENYKRLLTNQKEYLTVLRELFGIETGLMGSERDGDRLKI